jgi:steroid 5-alpha reductase family enzyme
MFMIHPAQLAGSLLYLMLAAAVVCFIVSEITQNYSQVDKLWSIMPIIYSLVTVVNYPSPRILVMSLLVVFWGIRLSFNFYRKGGYNIIPWKGEEDYRWKIMRQNPKLNGRIRFGLFNLLFISFYQHFLILMFSSPLLVAAENRNTDLNFLDFIAAALMLLFIIIETIADNQQFRFQSIKKSKEAPAGLYQGSLKKGFLSEGLWGFARHPNFASEQAVWISFYLFGVAASGKWINWTLTGPLLLVLLFIGSTKLTESLSSKKYPAYSEYQKKVPKYFPRLFPAKK